MNGLSLEFEGSTGQNEPGIFLGRNARLTIRTKFKKSKILTFLEIGQVTSTPRGAIGNFHFGPFWLKLHDNIWIRLFEPKDGIIKGERWPSLTPVPDLFLSLYRVKAKWSVGWSAANVSKGSCPRSTFINTRPSQTSTGTNKNNFCVNPSHHRRPVTALRKSKIIPRLKYTFSDLFWGSLWSRFKCIKLSQINNKQVQTLPNINLDQ